MEQSLFLSWVQTFFPGIVLRVVETLNGTTNPLTYLHRTMLSEELSLTGKWESLQSMYTAVMADIVSMDSELPLKARDAIGKASGDIPKQGMEMYLNETQLTALDMLIQAGGSNAQVAAKLFADVQRCITGIYERNEFIFLQGLSTGVALVDDIDNVGAGVRLDYKYLNSNKFGASEAVWTDISNAKPLTDLKRMVDQSKKTGAITTFYMDPTSFDNMVLTDEIKNAYAFTVGFVGGNILTPDIDQVNNMLQRRLGAKIQLIDRTILREKNGNRTPVKPWQPGMVIGASTTNVGSLVYAPLAEQNHRVAGVAYQNAGPYILVSKYSKNSPLTEVTSSQARCCPVISGVNDLYQLNTLVLQA